MNIIFWKTRSHLPKFAPTLTWGKNCNSINLEIVQTWKVCTFLCDVPHSLWLLVRREERVSGCFRISLCLSALWSDQRQHCILVWDYFPNFVKVETELRLAIPADGPGLFTSESCWNLPTGFHRGLSEAAAVAAAFSVATANGW